MDMYFITFRSVTLAQRGETVLGKRGIRSQLQRTPRWMEERGCGYCLKLSRENAAEAMETLKNAGVEFRKIYRQQHGGNVEEVVL